MRRSNIVTMARLEDTYHFHVGQPVEISRIPIVHRLWFRLTWWRRTRSVVTAVDIDVGTVTLAPMRWSWWRWKWVRQ